MASRRRRRAVALGRSLVEIRRRRRRRRVVGALTSRYIGESRPFRIDGHFFYSF